MRGEHAATEQHAANGRLERTIDADRSVLMHSAGALQRSTRDPWSPLACHSVHQVRLMEAASCACIQVAEDLWTKPHESRRDQQSGRDRPRVEHDCPMSKTCTLAHLFLQHLTYSWLPLARRLRELAATGSRQSKGEQAAVQQPVRVYTRERKPVQRADA